jgi:hypothetical protein
MRRPRRRANRQSVLDLDARDFSGLRMEQLLATPVECQTARCGALAIAHDACQFCTRGEAMPVPHSWWQDLWPKECPGVQECAAHHRAPEACGVCKTRTARQFRRA